MSTTPDKRCAACGRPKYYAEGCSRIECPLRRVRVVQPTQTGSHSVVYNGVRAEPTTKE